MAISIDGLIGFRFKYGGYDNFSYKLFIEEVIKNIQ